MGRRAVGVSTALDESGGGELGRGGNESDPDRSWAQYRFGTGCIVLFVQIVHGPGHIGRGGRFGTHRHRLPLGWGPKGRWFKSSRPD